MRYLVLFLLTIGFSSWLPGCATEKPKEQTPKEQAARSKKLAEENARYAAANAPLLHFKKFVNYINSDPVKTAWPDWSNRKYIWGVETSDFDSEQNLGTVVWFIGSRDMQSNADTITLDFDILSPSHFHAKYRISDANEVRLENVEYHSLISYEPQVRDEAIIKFFDDAMKNFNRDFGK